MRSAFHKNTFTTLPHIGPHSALFLDFDGTLVELASQPDAVEVAADLIPLLSELSAQLGGALAIVSGRRLSDLDRFLSPLKLPTAAEHGSLRRSHQGDVIKMATADIQEAARIVTAIGERHTKLRVEIKSSSIALHYRHAPELQAELLALMLNTVAGITNAELLQGKFVFEIKPAANNKGTAIESFMADAPFAGRLPLFAGDDTTDEAGFAMVQALGGHGIKVGAGKTQARYRCDAPEQLRQWLQSACLSVNPQESAL